jgi:hypothetical protein
MYANRSFRRIVPVVVYALTVLAIAMSATPAAAASDKFRITGSFVIASVQGANTTVDLSGRAAPGGQFTGQFTGKQFRNGDVRGNVTLDFGGGNTLTYAQELEFDAASNTIIGTYVITGGTGRFAGATGSGDTTIFPAGNGVGTFTLSGTLST